MKKRILSLFLVLIMVLGILPSAALAADTDYYLVFTADTEAGKTTLSNAYFFLRALPRGDKNRNGTPDIDKPIKVPQFGGEWIARGDSNVPGVLGVEVSIDGVSARKMSTVDQDEVPVGYDNREAFAETGVLSKISVFRNEGNRERYSFTIDDSAGDLAGKTITLKYIFTQEKTAKYSLNVNVDETKGKLYSTQWIQDLDGKSIYSISVRPNNGYQLSSYTMGTETTPIKLERTDYNFIKEDGKNVFLNKFQFEITQDSDITLNFTPASMELQLWACGVADIQEELTANWASGDLYSSLEIYGHYGFSSFASSFETNNVCKPLVEGSPAKFWFAININGYLDFGTEVSALDSLKIYKGDKVDPEALIFDCDDPDVLNRGLETTSRVMAPRCDNPGAMYCSIMKAPELDKITVVVHYAGYVLTETFDIPNVNDIQEAKDFYKFYTDNFGLDKFGQEAYTAEEKQTVAYEKYCQFSSFRFVLRKTYNEYLPKIALAATEAERQALLAEGKQALIDVSTGKGCNAVVWSFKGSVPAMVAVPADSDMHSRTGTTANETMQAALESMYPGNWTLYYSGSQFGAFINNITWGGEKDTGTIHVNIANWSSYGFFYINDTFSDWGVDNYYPSDGDYMCWNDSKQDQKWCWAKLRLYYGSDEALKEELTKRGVTKSISAMSAKEIQKAFSDLDDGSGKDFFRRYGQFREILPYETVIRLINQIGSVTPDSGEAIAAARAAYDALTKEEQAKVTNYQGLLDAEAEYAKLTGPADVDADTALNGALNSLLSGDQLTVGSMKGEWAILALARGGKDLSGHAEGYLEAVEQAITEGTLTLATDYARVTLALTAMGIDAPEKLLNGCADYDLMQKQGINAAAYCLMALNAKPYGEAYDEIREKYVAYLLYKALPTGGWIYGVGSTCDVDMTAMVIQALAPYAERENVAQAIDDALEALKLQQKPTGGFATFGTYNAESTAQMIVALTALGIDPTTWNGLNAVEALLHFYLTEDGKFAHTLGDTANQMATEQSAYALVAYSRYAAEKNSLYDMTDADKAGALQQVTSVRFALLFDGMNVTVDMETVNTAEEAEKLVEEKLEALGYSGNAYTVSIEDDHFTAAVAGTATNKSGEDGSFTATVTVTNGTVSASGLSVSGTITATAYVAPTLPSQPTAPVIPVVKPEATARNPFGDVTKDDWYYNAVLYVYENGLMNGTGSGVFAPNANTTRGMIVTILARQEGVDTSKGETWYEAGRQWAMENGISDGTDMDGQITREQLAAMLYRYANRKGYDTAKSISLEGYADGGKVSPWAASAMQWAVAEGLVQGSDNQLTPAAPATRAQVATILMRFLEKYN